MSEDIAATETDETGIWRDPAGIMTLGETPATAYTPILHIVKIECDSRHNRIARLRVSWSKPKPGQRRGMCPSCGKTATYQFSEDHGGV